MSYPLNDIKATLPEYGSGPKDNWLPILASSIVAEINDVIQDTDYLEHAMNELLECGFNSFFLVYDGVFSPNENSKTDYLRATLEMAAHKGLYVILKYEKLFNPDLISVENAPGFNKLNDQEKIQKYKEAFRKRVRDFIDTYKDIPSFGGICILDEPSLEDLEKRFDESKEMLDDFNNDNGAFYTCIANQYSLINEILPSQFVIFLNLIGDQQTDKINNSAGTPDYTAYLQAFKTIMSNGSQKTLPWLWSYDYYPIMEENMLLYNSIPHSGGIQKLPLSENGKIKVMYHDFYEDLILFNKYSRESNGVFWNYCQTMSYFPGNKLRPLALEQYIRFQVFSSLAMGAQGIMYWTYHQRSMKADGKELYLNAPINMQNERTAPWYYVQRINAEIRRYNSVFKDAKLVDWGHVKEIYSGCKLMTNSIGVVKSIETNGAGVLVTSLSNGSHLYTVIVSHDIRNYQDISISFVGQLRPIEVTTSVETGQLVPGSHDSGILNRTLPPGGYLIFEKATGYPPAQGVIS